MFFHFSYSAWLNHRKIISQLDALALQCREHFKALEQSLDVEEMNDIGLSEICTNICTFLRSQGFDAATGRESHRGLNSLLTYPG